jgi:hypothetical protein
MKFFHVSSTEEVKMFEEEKIVSFLATRFIMGLLDSRNPDLDATLKPLLEEQERDFRKTMDTIGERENPMEKETNGRR